MVRVGSVISKTVAVQGQALLRAELRDADGRLVAESEQRFRPEDGTREVLELTLDSPRLWHRVADPYLYTLDMFLSEDGSAVVDQVSEQVGIRKIEFDPERGFALNGEVLKLRGVNRHQDWQDFGWAIGPEQHERDFALIREMGATAVRMAHYPQDPYVLEFCDRLGLIVLMEIPTVGSANDSSERAPGLRDLTEVITWNLYPGWYGGASSGTCSTSLPITATKVIGRGSMTRASSLTTGPCVKMPSFSTRRPGWIRPSCTLRVAALAPGPPVWLRSKFIRSPLPSISLVMVNRRGRVAAKVTV
jgi:hypothetical protein